MKFHSLVILCFIILLVSACNGQPSLPTATAFQTQFPSTTSPLPTNSPRPTNTPWHTPTATDTPTPVPTQTLPPQGWLAYLESGYITIRDISGQQSSIVEGQYRQILGWSPNQAYLLAIRQDGASIVIDRSGKILAILDNLPQPSFWTKGNEENRTEDWLAVPKPDASLELLSFPSGETKILYEPGSLGADGLAFVRWGSNGEVILTSSLAQLQNKVSFEKGYFAWMLQNGPDVQLLSTGGNGGFASQDFHKAYFQVLDSVPGSPLTILLGFYNKDQCSSCSVDGLELTSLEPWSGKALPLGAVMLDTSEAYAWNPAQPGLLALAEGGSRFTLENKRLALLDIPAGTPPRYLTGKDQVVFEPSWSPDGRQLAYTTLPAQTQASDGGQDMEAQLGGRAIAVYDLTTDTAQTLTHPAKDEIDGWARWLADGQTLLFARKRLVDSTTQVWQLNRVTGQERLIVSISGAPQYCHRIGCGWDQMLAYAPGQSAVKSPSPAPVLAPTPTPAILADTPRQGMSTYHNAAYGFSFQYPSSGEPGGVDNLPNYIQLKSEKGALNIGYRRVTQQARIQRTGVGAGDFVRAGSIQFLGKTLKRDLLVYGGKTKEVFYQSDSEFSVGDLVFTLGLDNSGSSSYEDADIPLDVQIEADQILESFQLDGSTP